MKKYLLHCKKYIIMAVFGAVLIIVSDLTGAKPESQVQPAAFSGSVDQQQLQKILQTVDGAGEVNVYVSYKNDGTKEIAQQTEKGEKSVSLSPQSIGDSYYVLSNKRPDISGVLVTATGAANEQVKQRLLRAVKHALGIPYHIITVEAANIK